jgi:hypothetical protein
MPIERGHGIELFVAYCTLHTIYIDKKEKNLKMNENNVED